VLLSVGKWKHLSVVIEDEIDRNFDMIKISDKMQETKTPDGVILRKVDLMRAVLVHLDTHIWEENRQTIAEISSNKYLEYLGLENFNIRTQEICPPNC